MTRDDFIFCLLVAGCVAVSCIAVDIYLPAMPQLKHYFSASVATIKATVAAYMFGMVLAQLVVGPVANHYGFKRMLLPLSCLLILSSFLCAIASSVAILVLGRVLQSVAAGGMAVIGRASFTHYFPEKKASYYYVAFIPPVVLVSPAVAPIVGGLLAGYWGWRSIFIVLMVLGVVLFTGLCFKFNFQQKNNGKERFSLSVVIKNYFSLFKEKLFIAYLVIIIITYAIYFAYITEAPFVFHDSGYSIQQIGFSYLSISLGLIVTTQLVRKLLKHFSCIKILNMGIFLSAMGLLCAFIISLNGHLSMVEILILVTLYTSFNGFINPITMSQGIALFPKQTGYASSVVSASALLGSGLGVQFAQAVTQGSLQKLFLMGFILMMVSWLVFILSIPSLKIKRVKIL